MDATLMELLFGVHTQPVAYVMLFFINPWMGAVGAARTHAWRKINCIGHISLSLSLSLSLRLFIKNIKRSALHAAVS